MVKAKYPPLLCEPVSEEEAECSGLVSLAVDEAELLPKAWEVADRLAEGSQTRDPLDQVRTQQRAVPSRPGLRHLAGAGIHRLCRAGRARRWYLVARAGRPGSDCCLFGLVDL